MTPPIPPPPVPPEPTGTYQKISVSMPTEILVSLRDVAGRGNVSPYVTQAVRERLQRDYVAAWLERAARESGPPDEEFAAQLEAGYAEALESWMASGGNTAWPPDES